MQEPGKNTGTRMMSHMGRRRLCSPSCSSRTRDPSGKCMCRVACVYCLAFATFLLDPCLVPKQRADLIGACSNVF
jgi:hypothetical protein